MTQTNIVSKSVHRFTENAKIKFRPTFYQNLNSTQNNQKSLIGKLTSTISNIFNSPVPETVKVKKPVNTKSVIIQSTKQQMKQQSGKSINKQFSDQLIFLQKISPQIFLIGNNQQLDLITITGIHNNSIDVELNWSLNLKKPIQKIAVDVKKMLIAIQSNKQLHIYQYDIRNTTKNKYNFLNKIKINQNVYFLVTLKDSLFGVFYQHSVNIYQIDQNNMIKGIFQRKYGTGQTLELFQVPKPSQNSLNIFFKQRSTTSRTHILWRLQLQLRNISFTTPFKSLMRIYDIPNGLLNKFKIDNYSRDTFIMNFKFQILAAKDGYIIDSANTNIQPDQSCLLYQGDHLLHVTQNKLQIYSFKINTSIKPNKIVIQSVDSVLINMDQSFKFFDCLQMLNGNFVLFYQIKRTKNKKTKGQLDYIIIATQKLSVKQKLNQIFSFQSSQKLKQIAEKQFHIIQQKCDMAFKIGLNRKQIYLQLWNKSAKSSIHDYKFLLDTMDYETIKQQIQKKLKKSSMSFNEVYKLQQGCFSMLRQDLFSNSNCNELAIKNYLVSHFLLRKLQYYRDTHRNIGQNQKLNIDIQQYFQCVKMELKTFFLQSAFQFCFQGKNNVKEIRMFIKAFRFPLRIFYPQLLEQLIIQSKNKLLLFLKAIPQILPYVHSDIQQGDDQTLYQGITAEITNQEWTKNLHIEQISTIYNKTHVQQITKTVWFKRNQNSLHDLVALSKQKIMQISKYNQSQGIFYFFIQKIFQHITDVNIQKEVVQFIQKTYDIEHEKQLPTHLKGKIFLYKNLYDYFVNQKHNSANINTFNNFLKLQDYELFRQLFKYQKIKKGCLLKDAKQIYQNIKDGKQMYKQALLKYFNSPVSQISDLKYIMNRLNNQKRQFQNQNQGIYDVLVKGMQTKLRLGSQNDIPLEEVMIYFQSIPFSKDNPILQDLQIVQRIDQQAWRFKKIKINMSYMQIRQKYQQVIRAILDLQIQQKNVMNIKDSQQFLKASYAILVEVEAFKKKIYKNSYKDLQYYIYLSKLLEHTQMIQYAKLILSDIYLKQSYTVDERITQNLVVYMYKWRLQNQTYIKHHQYIMQLVSLLPEGCFMREYIEAQVKFAVLLSTPKNPIQYPLSYDEKLQPETIKLNQIEYIFSNMKTQQILVIDLQKIFQLVRKMQQISQLQQLITVQDIYQLAIKRLIQLGAIKQVLPKIRKLIKYQEGRFNYSIIFCYMVLNILLHQLPDSNRKSMIKLAFYAFNSPCQLLDVIEQRLKNKFSNQQQLNFISSKLQIFKSKSCYDTFNILLDDVFLSVVNQKSQKYKVKFQEQIIKTWSRIINSRQDFSKNTQFSFIYIMLINDPYALAKYLTIRQQNINHKLVRSFLSNLYREQLFNGRNILLFGRRLFILILQAVSSNISIQKIIAQLRDSYIQNDDISLINNQIFTDSFQQKICYSIKVFNKKLQSTMKNSKQHAEPKTIQQKRQRILAILKNQTSIRDHKTSSDYPFIDSDDNLEQQQISKSNKGLNKSKKQKKQVKQQNNLALFLSSHHQMADLKKSAPRLLHRTSSGGHSNVFQSVNFSSLANKSINIRSFDKNLQNSSGLHRAKSIGSLQRQQLTKSQNMDNEDNIDVLNSPRSIDLKRPTEIQRNNHDIGSPMTQVKSQQLNDENQIVSNNDLSPLLMKIPTKQKKNSQIKLQLKQLYDMDQQQNFFKVNIKQINQNEYTKPQILVKKIIADIDQLHDQVIFDMAIIQAQKQRDLGQFQQYIKQLISYIYKYQQKTIITCLNLIKSILTHFNQIYYNQQFLKIYFSLDNINRRYTYNIQFRQMFPIQGIFIESRQIKKLFQSFKQNILSKVDFQNIIVVAKMIYSSFQNSQIRDQLYIAYLKRAIHYYSNQQSLNEQQRLMQRQVIGGIFDQIGLLSLLVNRIPLLFQEIPKYYRQDISKLIIETLTKKKKDNLINQVNKILANMN